MRDHGPVTPQACAISADMPASAFRGSWATRKHGGSAHGAA